MATTTIVDYTTVLYVLLGINVFATAYQYGWWKKIVTNNLARRNSNNSNDINSSNRRIINPSDGSGNEHQQRQRQHQRNEKFEQEQKQQQKQKEEQHQQKQRQHHLLYYRYLPVYLCAVCADWLQGPYKYAVYAAYGYTQHDIAYLFVAGYGSGMSLGAYLGSYADTYGRKRMTLWYCVCYFFSCALKHGRPYPLLFVGRILGGIATSLLFSVFDSWFIKAATQLASSSTSFSEQQQQQYLSQSFATANYYNSLVAILAGLLANTIVGHDSHTIEPFFPPSQYLQPSIQSSQQMKLLLEYGQPDFHQPPFFQHHDTNLSSSSTVLLRGPRRLEDIIADATIITTAATTTTTFTIPSIPVWDDSIVLYKGGGIRAFDIALVPLVLCFLLTLVLWEENYGTTTTHTKTKTSTNNIQDILPTKKTKKKHDETTKNENGLLTAGRIVWQSSEIFTLCCVTSFFEGSMYVFVFHWTPALRTLEHAAYQTTNQDDDNYTTTMIDDDKGATTTSSHSEGSDGPPLGTIFASFMVCCMIGSSIFAILTRTAASTAASSSTILRTTQTILRYVVGLSAVCCGIIGLSQDARWSYAAMLVLEGCIGIYYPTMATIKGAIVPERYRSAIYNVFRFPMNIVVLLNLITNLSFHASFGLCSSMLAVSTYMLYTQTTNKVIIQ